MNTKKRTIKRKGSILALAIVLVILLAIIGAGMLTMGNNTRVFAARNVADISSRLCADAGLTKCFSEMENTLRNNTALLRSGTLPNQSNVPLDGSYGTYSYAVNRYDSSGNPVATLSTLTGSTFVMDSTGRSSIAQRNVHASITTKSSWTNCISVKDSVTIMNSAEFATWPVPDVPITIQTNSTDGSEGKIIIKNNVTIPGDVIIGPGGNIGEVVDLKGSSVIEGSTYASIEELQFPSVNPPTNLLYKGSIAGAGPITSSGQYSSINLGNSQILTINGTVDTDGDGKYNVDLYVTGNIVLGNSAGIVIGKDTDLTIYVGGNVEDKNSSGIEYESAVAPDATSFQLYGLDTCESIVLKAKTLFAGAIYAPNAAVDLKSGGDIYGAITAESLILRNGGDFYYDTRLGTLSYPPTLYFSLVRWWED